MVAFGYWAGYVGAALGVLHLADALKAPLAPMSKEDLDERLVAAGAAPTSASRSSPAPAAGPAAGAQKALATAGLPITRWDRQETRDLHKQAMLGHDILVNCVVTHTPTTPFVERRRPRPRAPAAGAGRRHLRRHRADEHAAGEHRDHHLGGARRAGCTTATPTCRPPRST